MLYLLIWHDKVRHMPANSTAYANELHGICLAIPCCLRTYVRPRCLSPPYGNTGNTLCVRKKNYNRPTENIHYAGILHLLGAIPNNFKLMQ